MVTHDIKRLSTLACLFITACLYGNMNLHITRSVIWLTAYLI